MDEVVRHSFSEGRARRDVGWVGPKVCSSRWDRSRGCRARPSPRP